MELYQRSLTDLRDLFQSGEATSLLIVETCLDRIKRHNDALNAFIEVFAEEAVLEAKRWDERRERGEDLPPLAGIPIAVKDVILVKGKRTTAGSNILRDYVAPYDATVIKRLKDAGAIIIGKTNLDEFAMGSSTETSAFGPTRNPWNLEKVSGGSSGGSAAAVASGMVPAALGTDTGGSVRQPAALCGVVGLKPTYGRNSRFGVVAYASSFDQVGVFAHSVDDVVLVQGVIQGRDPRDATSLEADTVISELMSDEVKGLKIGIPKEYFVEGMDEHIKTLVNEAAEVWKNGGAEVVEVSLPHAEYALAAYYLIVMSEASSNLARYDGVRYGHRAEADALDELYKKTRGEGFGTEVKRRIIMGTFALSAGYYDAYYKKALQVRAKIREDFDRAFQKVDLILTPTSPSVAWDLGEKFNDPLTMYLSDIYTISLNMAGVPGMSIPVGFAHGLPVGAQLIAKPLDEYEIYKAAKYYEEHTHWHKQMPPLG